MKEGKLLVTRSNRASVCFRNAYEKIKQDSATNAEKVRDGITKIIDGLPDNPEKFHPINTRQRTLGTTGHLKYSYRVAYTYHSKEIRILRVCHIKQEPKDY